MSVCDIQCVHMQAPLSDHFLLEMSRRGLTAENGMIQSSIQSES